MTPYSLYSALLLTRAGGAHFKSRTLYMKYGAIWESDFDFKTPFLYSHNRLGWSQSYFFIKLHLIYIEFLSSPYYRSHGEGDILKLSMKNNLSRLDCAVWLNHSIYFLLSP